MKTTNELEKIPTKECKSCGWQGDENDLTNNTGLSGNIDAEYIYCPLCWNEVIDVEK